MLDERVRHLWRVRAVRVANLDARTAAAATRSPAGTAPVTLYLTKAGRLAGAGALTVGYLVSLVSAPVLLLLSDMVGDDAVTTMAVRTVTSAFVVVAVTAGLVSEQGAYAAAPPPGASRVAVEVRIAVVLAVAGALREAVAVAVLGSGGIEGEGMKALAAAAAWVGVTIMSARRGYSAWVLE
ncbi:hypothetical protein BC828DRAFT_388086 [Blastocladiella britannica]|nr:hypothetical protein BC828DRAFT_388086 [Blastocladiella britannica]